MIIFDASTLILIAKAELLDLFLLNIGQPVAIPAEVERECCGGRKTLDSLLIQRALEASRMKVLTVKTRRLVGKLQEDFNLGKGEAEAIALALQEKARLLGIDDKGGINACKLLAIPFTNAVGILVRSREKRLLDGTEAFAKLAVLARNGRYRDSILADARTKLEAIR
jgi:predicted nucleic acid-binding protein